jgi:hypothetical protein
VPRLDHGQHPKSFPESFLGLSHGILETYPDPSTMGIPIPAPSNSESKAIEYPELSHYLKMRIV